MLTIAFTFPAGRLHATPWNRHVNEADVAWPPDSWRLVRAFIATWHRKLEHKRYPREILATLLGKMASSDPVYRLPAAVQFHTRHYMPVRKGSKGELSLIFDAFARVDPNDPLIVAWPELNLADDEAAFLDQLLEVMGYLGRAESWVEARRLPEWDVTQANCKAGNNVVNTDTGEITSEIVTLLAPLTPDKYSEFRNEILSTSVKRSKKEKEAIDATLPADWLEALSLDTSDLQRAGWSQPPAARKVQYTRPLRVLTPSSYNIRRGMTEEKPVTTVRLAIFGKPLPRIEDAVRVGEWARIAAMGRAKYLLGEDRIPSILSGHDLPDENRHAHAFWLPEDADSDGRIDHLFIYAPAGFDAQCQKVLQSITRLWNKDGAEYKVLFEAKGDAELFARISPLIGRSTVWTSVSPYLHPWHRKKGFGVAEQIKRECRERGISEPITIELLPEVEIAAGVRKRPINFHRFRTKRGLIQPDTHGCFLRLVFPEPIAGPLALGFGCHFGLGMFRPVQM